MTRQIKPEKTSASIKVLNLCAIQLSLERVNLEMIEQLPIMMERDWISKTSLFKFHACKKNVLCLIMSIKYFVIIRIRNI